MADEEDFLYGADEEAGGPSEAASPEPTPVSAEPPEDEGSAEADEPSEVPQPTAEEPEDEGNGLSDLDEADDLVAPGDIDDRAEAGEVEEGTADEAEEGERSPGTANGQKSGDPEDEDSEDSDDEDNIKISIDHNKIDETKTSYQHFGLNPKTARAPPGEKKGKFAVEDFDQVGTVNGAPAPDYDIEANEDKPWKQPGADITDYFNYGFTEETWQAYCGRQRKLRMGEAGVAMPGQTNNIISKPSLTPSILSSLSSNHAPKRLPTVLNRAPVMSELAKPVPPGPISVLTGDKRADYQQKMISGIDFSRPPPGLPPTNLPPPHFDAPPPVSSEFASEEPFTSGDFYSGGYEPTMESQWDAPPSTFSAPPTGDAPPGDPGYEDRRDVWRDQGRRPSRESRDRERYERERERKRRRTRSRSRDRHREHRDRERSERRDRERDGERERSSRPERESEPRSSERRSERRSRSPGHRSSSRKRSKRERRVKAEIKDEPRDD